MKSCLKKAITLLVLCLLAATTRATVLFQDYFSYPNGTLSNATWVAGSGSTLNNGIYVTNGNSAIIRGASASDLARAYFTNGPDGSLTASSAPNFPNTVYLFPTNNSVAPILYYSFTLTAQTAPVNNGIYVSYLSDTNFNFRCCVEVTTNHAAAGTYRLGILSKSSDAFVQTNSSAAATNIIQQNLTVGQTYFVLARYAIDTGTCTLWINPTNELSFGTNVISSSTPTNIPGAPNGGIFGFYDDAGTTNTAAAAVGLRSTTTSTSGNLQISNLVVSTSYAEAVPGTPEITFQPQDNTSLIAGNTVTLQTLGVANSTVSYQWYFTSNNVTTQLVDGTGISGSTNNILVLSNLATNEAGQYYCAVSTSTGTNNSRSATLIIYAAAIAPVISSPAAPYGQTNIQGDTVSFTVSATGVPVPSYKWFVITNNGVISVTNPVAASNITGTNTSTLTITSVSTNQSGSYFAVVTNLAGTNLSPLITLLVNPIPFYNISTVRSMVDPVSFLPTNTTTLVTIQGTVSTWTNMTTSTTSTEFYMQDSTAGIAVFWSGAAPSTNLPPPGAVVKVTGPLAQFNGLLEIEPVLGTALNSVVVVSTNTPANIPKPQPLPFDVNLTEANLKAMESSYLVASNVFLAAGPTFVSGANDTITNNGNTVLTNTMTSLSFTNLAGQTFVLFINAGTDIPNKVKPSGPVTIFGVLGYFSSAGFEFTPSRYADIISYIHVTNVLANARPGDLATNTYADNVVRPGETITTYVSIGDAAGGSVSLAPTGTLPTGAAWSSYVPGTPGTPATIAFHYTGSAADAGIYFPVQLNVSSDAGTAYTETFPVYVPTPQEQQMAITEFLANPTTNTSAAFYNPLQRASAVNGISTNDQYVEIVNQSGTDLTSKFTLDTGTAALPVFSSFDGFGSSVLSSNSLVVYGGNGSPVQLPGLTTPVAVSRGLFLSTNGTGIIALRNTSGYLIDRVTYTAASLSTNGSLTRFPSWTNAFVPQAYVNALKVTPGAQYDGSPWSVTNKVPSGVGSVKITYVNGKAVLTFTANTTQASTLWNASSVTGPYNVILGQVFSSGSGAFTNSNPAAQSFYYITTQ